MPATTGGCVRLREDQVGFLPDQANLRDANTAGNVLEPVAATLRSSGQSATLIGTTALPEDPPYALSTARAEAILGLLVSLGVDRKKLTAVGVGTNFGDYVSPLSDGRFNETIAVQDRLVIIVPGGVKCD